MGGRIFRNGRTIDFGGYINVAQDVTIVGRNTALSTIADIWPRGAANNGVHTIQAAAGVTLGISSASANDTAAGSGARTVNILAVDSTGIERLVTLTMNGQTKVSDTSGYKFVGVNLAWVATWGSGLTNAGKTYIYDASDTTATGENATIGKRLSMIDAGDNWSRCGFYTVPSLLDGSKCDLAIYGVSFTNQDATTTIKYGAGSAQINYLNWYGQTFGAPGAANYFLFDLGQFSSSGTGPSEIPAGNIKEPLFIVKNGGTINFQGVMSAAPTAVGVIAWGALLVPGLT